jgi:hypothetical protein
MTVIIRTLFIIYIIMFSIVVRSQDDTVFRLVRDASELKEGDVLVIVNRSAGVALSTEQRSNNRGSTPVAIADDDVVVTPQCQFLILEGTASGWYFNTGNGYLAQKEGGKAQSFLTQMDKDNNSRALIDVSSATGEAVVKFQGGGTYRTIQCNTFNSPIIFSCYSSTLNNGEVYLYKGSAIPHFPTSIVLDGDTQEADNSDAITSYLNMTVDRVTLQRTFVGDGGWYSLCLPFALTAEDISTKFLGADFQEFTGVTMNADNTFNLDFRSVSQTQPGVPYLVRPVEGTEITDPVFMNKLISEAQPLSVVHALQTEPFSEYSFTGIYNSTDLFQVDPSAGKTIRFVNADGTQLVRPINDGTKLKATRAYVRLPAADTKARIRHHEGDTDGIYHLNVDSPSRHTGVYDLGGRYMGPSAEGLARGVYIVDGRKIVIK